MLVFRPSIRAGLARVTGIVARQPADERRDIVGLGRVVPHVSLLAGLLCPGASGDQTVSTAAT